MINLEEHGLTVTAQPGVVELEGFAEAGVRTVVNLRHAGEFGASAADAGPLTIEAEGEVCRRLGMDYVNLPVSMKPPPPKGDGADPRLATAFEAVLMAAREQGPVVVHCKLGQRAGAMVLIALGRHQKWNGAKALSEAGRLGLAAAVEPAKLRDYVVACLGE
ncbi:MAG: sulfur transferase domain-containing protein [Planctomycetota bacterium]